MKYAINYQVNGVVLWLHSDFSPGVKYAVDFAELLSFNFKGVELMTGSNWPTVDDRGRCIWRGGELTDFGRKLVNEGGGS